MYRAVGWKTLQEHVALDDEPGVAALAQNADITVEGGVISIDGHDVTRAIRTPEIDKVAAAVARLPRVREVLVARQRALGGQGGVVMEGRDIGTVVCPDAIVKFFVTASLEARAERRHRELLSRYGTSIYSRVLEEMKERDERDRTRAVAPLAAAPDALVIDTTTLSPDAAFQVAVDHINRLWRG